MCVELNVITLCVYMFFSPRLTNHPRGHRSQDSLHHGQMLPVVMSLKEIQIDLDNQNSTGRRNTKKERLTQKMIRV